MNEVVTKALLRLVPVPGLERPAALITLDNGQDHRRPNTLGPAGMASLDAAIDEAFAAEPGFVAVTGKPNGFCAGADLTGMSAVSSREEGQDIARLGHRVFARLHDSPVPTFAFVNGAAMGGGLELALHCHYRTLSTAAKAIALPECSLGLVPGWGGTHLLPNLIGAQAAVKVIVENPLAKNRILRPTDAAGLGVVDVLYEPADFLEQSLSWAAAVVSGTQSVNRPVVERGEAWQAALARGRAVADARVHGAAPAPYRALELIALAETASLAESAAAEDSALADLLLTPELRSGLYVFDLVQRRAKRPAGAPDEILAREVTKVGIVGAGLMAAQIALLFAQQLEVPVVLTDVDQTRVDAGLGHVRAEIDKLAGKGRITAPQAGKLRGLISASVDKDVFADADLVLEAVFEDLGVKKQVLGEVEKIVRQDCVLATNTSSLSVADMAADLAHPERVVGLHFFNPVALLPLVEVIRTPSTDQATLATAFAVGKRLRKSCVLVADAPGFVVNRLLVRFMNVVFEAVDAGTPIEVAENALAPWGLPMLPFALLQLVGPAVTHHMAQSLHAAWPDRFTLSPNVERLVRAGKPGIYLPDKRPDPAVPELFEVGDDPSTPEAIRSEAARALAVEIGLMLAEGVVADPRDIDLCLILGAGWPAHLGGIVPFLDRTGVSQEVLGRTLLPAGCP
jgi:3-hydroxyacyl-CoA dehydrogenase/enoyl-CoA hydratase/carnithine racemase